MTAIDSVISFDPTNCSARDDLVDNPNLLSPPYRSTTWQHFSNDEKDTSAGVWEAGPFAERFTGEADEFCHLLEGNVRLVDEAGAAKTFKAGDTFVIPKGFSGVWENLTKVKKVYVLF